MNKKQDNPRTEAKPFGIGSDLLLTAWILVIAVAYYGPVIDPGLGRDATVLAPVYALMVLLSVLSLFMRYSRRQQERRGGATSIRKSGR